MQLANQREVTEQEMSPSIHAALIDSLFEAPAPLLSGLAFAAIAAAMTALKTGEILIWACVALLIATGAVRAFDLHRYQKRKSTMTAAKAAGWKKRYQTRAIIQPAAIGIWCATTLLCSDDAVAHMIALSVTGGLVAGGAARAYGRQWIFQLQVTLCFGPVVVALALHGSP
jgi:1,4-dihydroxy-2-naphthoate octaprenyltransferase